MILLRSKGFDDYELIDSGNGQRLERFGKYILVRPDPQVLWKMSLSKSEWDKADARFIKGVGDKGEWKNINKVPAKWLMGWNGISFYCELTPFKHTGVFPEQSVHWEWMAELIKNKSDIKILNLFGYTGIASLVAAKAGAKVTHIDASYPAIGWARENQKASGLEDKPIRWILDDAIKFCQREIKRGVKYDGILMDPPIYGHGPKGEKWDFDNSFPELVQLTSQLLSGSPLFYIVNAYAISASAFMLENVLKDYLDNDGTLESGELVLEEKSARLLSTGIFARWSR